MAVCPITPTNSGCLHALQARNELASTLRLIFCIDNTFFVPRDPQSPPVVSGGAVNEPGNLVAQALSSGEIKKKNVFSVGGPMAEIKKCTCGRHFKVLLAPRGLYFLLFCAAAEAQRQQQGRQQRLSREGVSLLTYPTLSDFLAETVDLIRNFSGGRSKGGRQRGFVNPC